MEPKALTEAVRAAYITMQAASGFKIGDRVKIIRKAKNYEMGWRNSWVLSMDKHVGTEATITGISTNGTGITVAGAGNYTYPFFVLELVKPAKPAYVPKHIKINDSYTADVYEDHVRVGCQRIDFAAVKNLALAVKAAQEYAKS